MCFAIARAGVDCFSGFLDSINIFRILSLLNEENKKKKLLQPLQETALLNLFFIASVDVLFRSSLPVLVSNLYIYDSPIKILYYVSR